MGSTLSLTKRPATVAAPPHLPPPTTLVDGPIVYSCLQSIPIDQQSALDLVESLVPYVELQSTLAYLKNPPSGYLYPRVDIIQGLKNIAAAVAAGKYNGEYDFQTDLQALFVAGRDGHMSYQADLIGVASFKVPNTPLVSFSADGVQTPQIFCTSDMLGLGPTGIGFRDTSIGVSYSPSELTTINGMNAVQYLIGRAEEFPIQDPDAAYNYLFSETAQIAQLGVYGDGGFPNPAFYPGDQTVLGFINGSFSYIPTGSEVYASFDGVIDGLTAYQKFCNKSSVLVTTNNSTQTQAPSPTVPFYPWPVIKNSENRVAGYFLNDTGNTDVAVLTILNFDAVENAAEFISDVQRFLLAAAGAGKTKLIVDVFANGGGLVELGIATFNQLFPNMYPHAQGNMRTSDVLNYIGLGESALGSSTPLDEPFDYNSDQRPDGSPFKSWSDLYGPVALAGDNFTELFEENINKDPTVVPIDVNPSAPASFAPENIIILTDGFCASTCAVFVELMKNLGGVKSIVVGGRPQNGPMQAVGGTKGKQSFAYEYVLISALNATEGLTNSQTVAANKSDFALLSEYPLIRAADPVVPGINGQNNIRLGDNSTTPLQFVYEAADCRIFFTHDMLVSQVPIWSRAANITWGNQTYLCVDGSTFHASSVSGGFKNQENAGVDTVVPDSARLGSIIPLYTETNSTAGSNSTMGWGGKAWGIGGLNLAQNRTTSSTSTTSTKTKTTTKTKSHSSTTTLLSTMTFSQSTTATTSSEPTIITGAVNAGPRLHVIGASMVFAGMTLPNVLPVATFTTLFSLILASLAFVL